MGFRLLERNEIDYVINLLEDKYKGVKYYLNFQGPLQLLVAAILSAQTRDIVVNSLTPELFSKYKNTDEFASAKLSDLIMLIRKVSFAKDKAKNIIECCRILREKYNGEVPDTLEDLLSLPGVGRKTATTVLINAFGKVEGIPVDTWVIKLSYRMGLSKNKKPDDIEKDLKNKIDKKYWKNIAYVLKEHGHEICQSLKPRCEICPINKICPKNEFKVLMYK